MTANASNRAVKRVGRMMTACALGLVATAVFGVDTTPGREAAPNAAHRADLERAFWICDYTATTRGLDATPVEACITVTDELRDDRFGGDFMALLAWWRENKMFEHAKLERAIDAAEHEAQGPRGRDTRPDAATFFGL